MSDSSENTGESSPGARSLFGRVASAEVPRPLEDGRDFHIVGIGASAGGLESLERLFGSLPADTGMAFVVLQHLSPDFKSLMDELLARRTEMTVRLAGHDMPVEPNTIYLLPPTKEMIIRHRRLLLSDRDPRQGLTLPIDLFFRSLAQDAGERAVAVVLSGSGSDGSRGVIEVSRAGGMVLAESPDTAQFNGMPLSAMRTGVVDHVLSPEELAAAITALPRSSAGGGAPSPGRTHGFDGALGLLREEFGIDFSHYKTGTVVRRIERRLAMSRSLDLDTYIEQLRSDPRELSSLYEDLLIGVTRFFRDVDAFEALERRVVPQLVTQREGNDPVRVWVPGCATGEEAYSIAMLLLERFESERRPVRLKILATDVHKRSLDVASAGVYSQEQVAGISDERLRRFFVPRGDGYQVSDTLRQSVVFAAHNLIRDAPFTRMDLIACRNLLIYFQPPAQKTVLTLFHFALKQGGILFLGSSETPGALSDEFDAVDEGARIYRKQRDVGLPRDLKLPLPRARGASKPAPGQSVRGLVTPQLLSVYDRLLERFMPPSFLVDEQGQLVDMFGGVEAYLKIRSRRPTQNLIEMLGGDLKPIVSTALKRVRDTADGVRYPTALTASDGKPVSVIAEPVRDAQGSPTHVLISLLEPDTSEAVALVPPFADVAPIRPEEVQRIDGGMSLEQQRALEEDLAYTREHLRVAIQEQDTANEELQATNEELIAANEELQSTNEELHSVNEELYTVNAEYQKKNLELQELNSDIEHLLNGTEVATMFLDRSLSIRRFTPRIAETFHLIPLDVGRPVRSFTHDLLHQSLMSDIEQVLESGTPIETTTRDQRGRCLFLRILPYYGRSDANGDKPALREAPDGVVLTLTDISALEQARVSLEQVSAIVESSGDAIVGKTLDGVVTTWNAGATRMYGYSVDEAIGRHASFLYPPGRKEEIENVLQEVRAGRPVERIETQRRRKDGTLVDVSVTFSPMYDANRTLIGISGISRDITQLVRARQEVAEREERIRLLLDSAAEAIYGIDLSGVCIFSNLACAKLLGYEPDQLAGRQMHQLIHHTRPDGTPYPPELSPIYQAMRHREGTHVENEVIWRADGTSFPAEYWSHPILRNGELIGAVVTFLDVTARRKAEQELQEGVRRREQFLAMLSHELRNPLAAILTATRVLQSAGSNVQECKEAGQVVARQANHMSRLLDDLLDVARITRGRIALRRELIDLRQAARAAIEALTPFMAERGTQLEVNIASEPVWVDGDPARLQQIQANLLSNASKYSASGGRVCFELFEEDGRAVIRVSDEGVGIAQEMLPRIFDLFVQGDQSLARSEGGLGIGLTLLRSLVELHEGEVEARSEGLGKGSAFTVRLPLARRPGVQAAALPDHVPVRSVALVEDQSDARRMMQLLLEAEGVEVHAAENGQAGVELIERIKPDLALVDLGLPVMSGFELARRVRSNPANAHTRLVALSGYGQDSDVQASLAAGFDEHLTKPPDPARIERLLKGAHTRVRA